ncbi:MAG: Sir2 family NAD-dependent protein deacetylase [Acidobacteriota bacterium]
MNEIVWKAARVVMEAEALVVSAGAGMGVDSGLPDFRGDQGFWKAYPPFARLGLSFVDMANPYWFANDPTLAWGFYGHRLNLYRETHPHDGFGILLRWARSKPGGCFVFTSNVDGQFQTAGFDEDAVVECHGSIHYLQCAGPCGRHIWAAGGVRVEVDESTMRAAAPLPGCNRCGGLARPNVLMFGDWSWLPARTSEQERRFQEWLIENRSRPTAVIECGAGRAVPTVRATSERIAAGQDAVLVRINVREPEVPRGHIGIAHGALDTLRRIDECMRAGG